MLFWGFTKRRMVFVTDVSGQLSIPLPLKMGPIIRLETSAK